MKHILLLFFMILPALSFSDPWGKDADLVHQEVSTYETISGSCTTPFFGSFAECAINFHQKIISPADGPRSHFYPSSSQYTKEAMRKYGFAKGFIMGCDRLMRENSDEWIYRTCTLPGNTILKYDPVP